MATHALLIIDLPIKCIHLIPRLILRFPIELPITQPDRYAQRRIVEQVPYLGVANPLRLPVREGGVRHGGHDDDVNLSLGWREGVFPSSVVGYLRGELAAVELPVIVHRDCWCAVHEELDVGNVGLSACGDVSFYVFTTVCRVVCVLELSVVSDNATVSTGRDLP